MHRNEKGFTLPEILIGLAISTIIIAASFASYIVIKNNYDFQKDMKNISQTSRAVATMIMRDVRMAGFNYDDGPTKQKPEIANGLKIVDGGNSSSDKIEIIYDKSYTERLKISYYTKAYNNRMRLYKKVEKCNAMNCATSSLQTIIAESTIADYIEDLQFIGSSGTCASGDIKLGCGRRDWIYPSQNGSITGEIKTVGDAVNDSSWPENPDTYALWRASDGVFFVGFDKPVRIFKVKLGPPPAYKDKKSGWFSNPPTFNPGQDYQELIWPYSQADLGFTTNINVEKKGNITSDGSKSSMKNVKGSRSIISYDKETIDLSMYYSNDFSSAVTMPYIASGRQSKLEVTINNYKCGSWDTSSPKKCTAVSLSNNAALTDISFYGEIYDGLSSFNTVEIGLLIRSPEEHGNSPVAQTWEIGNRQIKTNDNYIRDAYSISTLARNLYYE